MPFTMPKCNSGRCQFTQTECKKGCVAATTDPEDVNNWKCLWVEALKTLTQISGYRASLMQEAFSRMTASQPTVIETQPFECPPEEGKRSVGRPKGVTDKAR